MHGIITKNRIDTNNSYSRLPSLSPTIRPQTEKLIELELEVVQLQQNLHMISLEWTSRGIELQYAKHQANAAEDKATELEDKVAILQQQLKKLQKENASLRGQLAASMARKHAAEAEAADLRTAVGRLSQQLLETKTGRKMSISDDGNGDNNHPNHHNQDNETNLIPAYVPEVPLPPTRKDIETTSAVLAEPPPPPPKALTSRQNISATTGKRRTTTTMPCYGDLSNFNIIATQYNESVKLVQRQLSSSNASSNKWVQDLMSSTSSVDTDPKHVDKAVKQLLGVCSKQGLDLPLTKGLRNNQYALGKTTVMFKLVNSKLMVKSGPSCIDVMSWLARQSQR
jgi:hypothetical protein